MNDIFYTIIPESVLDVVSADGVIVSVVWAIEKSIKDLANLLIKRNFISYN